MSVEDSEWLDRMHKFGKHLEKRQAEQIKAANDTDYMARIGKMIDDMELEERRLAMGSVAASGAITGTAIARTAEEIKQYERWKMDNLSRLQESLAEELRQKMIKELYEKGFSDDIWTTDGMPDKPKRTKIKAVKTKHLDDELFEI